MAVKVTWTCDRCGAEHTESDTVNLQQGSLPLGWRAIEVNADAASLQHKLLCRDCMKALTEFVENGNEE